MDIEGRVTHGAVTESPLLITENNRVSHKLSIKGKNT